MKVILAIVALCCIALSAFQYVPVPFTHVAGGATIVQSCATASGPVTSPTCVFGSSTTTGNTILIIGWSSGAAGAAPTATGYTFTQVTGGTNPCTTATYDQYFYADVNITGGAAPTISWTGSNGNSELHAIEVHGLATGQDGSPACASGTTAASPISSGTTSAPSGSNEFAFAGVRQDTTGTTFSIVSPYTVVKNTGNNFASSSNIVSAATTAQFGYTGGNGNPYESSVCLFK